MIKSYLEKENLPYDLELFHFRKDEKLLKLRELWKPNIDKKFIKWKQKQIEEKLSNRSEFRQFEDKFISLNQKYRNLMGFPPLNYDPQPKMRKPSQNSFAKKEMVILSENNDKPQKETNEVFPYQQINLTELLGAPQKIPEKLIEGYNYPGVIEPMPVDSSSLPKGWQKSVIRIKG